VGSNNRLDLLEEARIASLLQRVRSVSPETLGANELLRLCTIDGARALGLDDQIGTLEPGKQADLCAVSLGSPHAVPTYDPVVAIFHSARGSDVVMTVVGAITASDLHPTTLEYASAATADYPEISVARADALSLPFGDATFDIVTSYTTLHHFDRADAATVLREMVRVSRRAVVVTDLSRSGAALVGANLLAGTLWRNHPITKHDGPASVRAAFRPGELLQLAQEVTTYACKVRRHPLFRLSLVIAKDEGTSS
jgi:hypothetical protein